MRCARIKKEVTFCKDCEVSVSRYGLRMSPSLKDIHLGDCDEKVAVD
jgi:hypothetical protein